MLQSVPVVTELRRGCFRHVSGMDDTGRNGNLENTISGRKASGDVDPSIRSRWSAVGTTTGFQCEDTGSSPTTFSWNIHSRTDIFFLAADYPPFAYGSYDAFGKDIVESAADKHLEVESDQWFCRIRADKDS